MKKILVPTDFSTASKAGMRFAIQLASQIKAELVFFHCFQALIPITVFQERLVNSLQEQSQAQQQKLERFVAKLYAARKGQAGKHRCVVVEALSPDDAILTYAQRHGVDFICMSTRGAGAVLKFIGTHTGDILQRSPIPVFVVPHPYRVRPIHHVLYASDLDDFDREMAVITDFAQTLPAPVDLAHIHLPEAISLDRNSLVRMWRVKHPQLNRIHLEPYRHDQDVTGPLNRLIGKTHPAIVAFFTHPRHTWFDKLFGRSATEAISFVTRTPMLVYHKPKSAKAMPVFSV